MTSKAQFANARKACANNVDKNIFVIMRYGQEPAYSEIERTVVETLQRYGFSALIARDVEFAEDLWENIRFSMENSRYAIVIFEDINRSPTHSPNVALELGYMLALQKRCLILKEKSLSTVPTDVIGKRYQTFDMFNLRASLEIILSKWLDSILGSFTRRAELIIDEDPGEVLKKRTQRVIAAYNRPLAVDQPTIRLAAITSALAVSPNSKEHCGPDIQALFLRERQALMSIMGAGGRIRCMVAPRVYLERFGSDRSQIERGRNTYLPRYDALIRTIEENLENDRLEIVWTEQLPRHSLIILGNETAFVGTRTTGEYRTRATMIYDPVIIQHEIEEFEYAFVDTVKQFSTGNNISADDPMIHKELKIAVKKEVHKCRKKLLDLLSENG